jgi:phosphoglycolate phosphatase
MLKEGFPLSVRVVAIDLDGTLLDTIHALAEAANRMRGELGLPPLPVERVRSFVGKGLATLVNRSLTDSLDEVAGGALFDRVMAIFERQYLAVLTHGLREYPGVGEGLRRLRAAGFKLACVTNKPGKFTEPLLTASGLRPYFDLVVSGDTTARRKPDPMPLLYTAKTFGVRPEDMLLVGDSANDFEAARAAGCRIFLVPYGYNEGRDATALPADAIVPGLVEAAELIENSAA